MGVTPTLSQVENWDIEHLTEAAKHWTSTAIVWEDCFTQLAVQILNPGGEPWEGEAAEAAQHRAYTDKMTVIGLADQLHDASAIAKAGAMELAEAKRLVLRTVDAAKAAGFTVGEDFSVTDHHVYNRAAAAMRQAQAEGFAADLRATVADLVAADNRIAGKLISATAGLGKDPFAESGGAEHAPRPPQMGVDRNPLTIEEREANRERTIDLQDQFMESAGAVMDATSAGIGEVAKKSADANPGLAALMGESAAGVSRYGTIAATPFTGLGIYTDVARDGENFWRATTREVSKAGYGMAIGKASTNFIEYLPKATQAFMSGLAEVGAAGAEVAGTAGVGAEVAEAGLGAGLLASGLEGAEAGALLGGPVGAALGLGVGLAAAYFFSDDAAEFAGNVWDWAFG